MAVLTWKRLGGGMSPAVYACLLVPLMLFDTWRIDRQFLRYFDPDLQPPPERVYGGVLRHFEQDPDLYRVLFVSQHSVPPPHHGRRQADDCRPGPRGFSRTLYHAALRPDHGTAVPPSFSHPESAEYTIRRDPGAVSGARPASLVANGLHIYRNEFALALVLPGVPATESKPTRPSILEAVCRSRGSNPTIP